MANGFSFKLFPGAIKKLTDAQLKALEATGEKMLAEKIDAQQIPFDEGTLQNVQSRVDKADLNKGKIKIVHDTPYAQRLYYHPEYNFNKTFNPNAQGEWWEDYLTGDKKDRPEQLFAHYLRRFGRETIT